MDFPRQRLTSCHSLPKTNLTDLKNAKQHYAMQREASRSSRLDFPSALSCERLVRGICILHTLEACIAFKVGRHRIDEERLFASQLSLVMSSEAN